MLEEKYLSVLGADSKGQLLAELVRFTRQLGFSTVSATVVLDQPPGVDPKFFWLENVPDAYRDTFSDPRSGKLDPVVAAKLSPDVPISEQTAARHLHNASKKLACVNKHQAVLKALQMNLIS